MTTDETQTPTVIRPRRSQRDVLFGFLIAILAFAILRGLLAGGDRSTATTVILVVLAVVLVVFLVGWVSIIRRPTLLEVGPDTIRLTRAGAKKEEPPISRAFGNELAFGIGGTSPRRKKSKVE